MICAEVEKKLISDYKRIFTEPPDWSFPYKGWNYQTVPLTTPFPPGIPFIGQDYFNQNTKIALYASAENLAHYERKPETIPKFLCDERVWNRHRAANSEGWDKFFPRLHIGPVEDGSLLCATLFICQKLDIKAPTDPKKFLESLAVANVGKFSIAGMGPGEKNINIDFAGNEKMLEPSLPFLRSDLELLSPDIIILPKKMHQQPSIQNLISEILPKAKVLPVYQFNNTVVNIYLRKNEEAATLLAKNYKETILDEWANQLKGYREGYPYRFFAELDSEISKADIFNL